MKKNGFTLVELLATIALLAVIITVTAPIIINQIAQTRQEAFIDNANMLIKAANNYYAESQINKEITVPLLATYKNGNVTYCNNKAKLEYSGKNPTSGNIYISATGEVEIRIYDSQIKKCVEKTSTAKQATINENLNAQTCVLSRSC